MTIAMTIGEMPIVIAQASGGRRVDRAQLSATLDDGCADPFPSTREDGLRSGVPGKANRLVTVDDALDRLPETADCG